MKTVKEKFWVFLKKFGLGLFFISILFGGKSAKSNNVQITNANRIGLNRDLIQFTLSWENSWYVTGAPANHDAVWVFIKFRECGQTTQEWNHARLSTTMTDHTLGPDLAFAMNITTTDRWGNPGNHNTGAMIRRKNVGVGNITNQVCILRVVGSTSGATLQSTKEYDIKVFGIEMVFIPQGEFYVGDSWGTRWDIGWPWTSDVLFKPGSSTREAVLIQNENPVTIRESNAYDVTVPLNFPKGYSSFYIMKYEITQQQYCNFLNTLTTNQSNARKYHYDYYQHDIQTDGSTFYTTRQDRPKNYLSFEDLLSYLDWAALRPITELEFEKACRGPRDFVIGEYAWGSQYIKETKTVSGATAGVEIVTDTSNCHVHITQITISGGQFQANGRWDQYGPVAAGIYARSTTTPTRVNTGATYYGVMEMSGNLWEQCIQINLANSSTPSSYTGIWGDGRLTSAGVYNVTNWPTTDAFILKGGAWNAGREYATVSNRSYRNRTDYTSRDWGIGGRGAR